MKVNSFEVLKSHGNIITVHFYHKEHGKKFVCDNSFLFKPLEQKETEDTIERVLNFILKKYDIVKKEENNGSIT